MVETQGSPLILALPDTLREGLTALLRVIPSIREVHLADDLAEVARLSGLGVRPNLILADAGLLGADLRTGLDRLSALFPEVTTILLTDSREQEEAAARAGAQAVLRKGILADQLLGRITEWLSRGSAG